MCNNVLLILLSFLLTISSDTFRLFSSADAGTYKEARPFFTSSKHLVNDYFDGNLALASNMINAHTFVFAMYYANFCGISRRMREPFEKAAAFYRERLHNGNQTSDKFHVKFIAIDCFFHEGACRKTYKLNYYPQLFLYIKGARGYQYFGPAITANIIDFAEKIRLPVIRLTNREEFLDFLVQHESSVLAQFDLSDPQQRQSYSLFVQAALKLIEHDNEHPVRFALILDRSITEELVQLTNQTLTAPFILQYHFDAKLQVFPNMTDNFTMETLFNWALSQHDKPHVGWIVPKNRYYSRSPSADKATIVEALTDHDNLLVFLTSNNLDELRLRHLYITLNDCNVTHSTLWLSRLEQIHQRSMADRKQNLTKSERHLLTPCCHEILDELSRTDLYQLCLFHRSWPLVDPTKIKTESCLPIFDNPNWQKHCTRSYCHQWLTNVTSIDRPRFDDHHELLFEKRRTKFYAQELVDDRNDLHLNSENISEKYRGLLCRTNTTWAFRLIDTRLYPKFAANLGVNHSRAILVLQAKNEQQYLLNDKELTVDHIYNLIYEISYHLRSRSLTTIPSHSPNDEQSNRLIELTTDTFHSTVVNTRKHVLVVYYTKWCGFCRSIWPVVFQAKAFFHNFNNLIFTRIQADKHDLPWHLTVFTYPTIMLFPADEKNSSIVFPSSAEAITSVHLIRFLLYHLYVDHSSQSSWCPRPTNNSFLTMLSSSYVDFSQLSLIVKSL